jgi:hypothetical protein
MIAFWGEQQPSGFSYEARGAAFFLHVFAF